MKTQARVSIFNSLPFWPPTKSSRGFTLIEVLVVVAIVGILLALLIPALKGAKEKTDQTACASNLRQIGIALLTYHNDWKMLPIGWAGEDWTWNSSLKMYLTTYNAGGNANRIRIKLACPSVPRANEWSYNYMYNDNLFLKDIGSIKSVNLRPIVTDADNVAASQTLTGNVKEAHRDGANYLYLDGHVEWKGDPDENSWKGQGAPYQ